MPVLRIFLLGLLLVWQCVALGQGVQAVPQLTGRVIDQTGTLDASTLRNLADKLIALETEKGSQVVLLMVASTQPEDIATYANRVANEWKIGRKNIGDGVLIVVAKNDRKLRIEVAKTLEGAIPDLAAKQIIDEAITPKFKQGDYGAGLSAAVDQIAARIRGEALPAPRSGSSLDGFQWFDLLAFLLVGAPMLAAVMHAVFGRKHGSLLTGLASGAGAYWFTRSWLLLGLVGFAVALVSFLSNGRSGRRSSSSSAGGSLGGWSFGGSDSGSSWGGSSRSGSGGFSSGGGGDFGGGGASGDW